MTRSPKIEELQMRHRAIGDALSSWLAMPQPMASLLPALIRSDGFWVDEVAQIDANRIYLHNDDPPC